MFVVVVVVVMVGVVVVVADVVIEVFTINTVSSFCISVEALP